MKSLKMGDAAWCCSGCGLQCILTALTKDRLVDMLCHGLGHVLLWWTNVKHWEFLPGKQIAHRVLRWMEPSCYRIAAKCANKQFEVHGSGEASAWQPAWYAASKACFKAKWTLHPATTTSADASTPSGKQQKHIRPALKCHRCYWCYQA